ncbi:MAG: DUF1905 domain-containing protein [Cypionkella sp.]
MAALTKPEIRCTVPARAWFGRVPMRRLTFKTKIIEWRGPAPFAFAPIPPEHVEPIAQAARLVSYGWGMIPVEARIGGIAFTTALFPKDGGYLLPLKDRVRRQAGVTIGDSIVVELLLGPPR